MVYSECLFNLDVTIFLDLTNCFILSILYELVYFRQVIKLSNKCKFKIYFKVRNGNLTSYKIKLNV